jgi:hypothetical protein
MPARFLERNQGRFHARLADLTGATARTHTGARDSRAGWRRDHARVEGRRIERWRIDGWPRARGLREDKTARAEGQREREGEKFGVLVHDLLHF